MERTTVDAFTARVVDDPAAQARLAAAATVPHYVDDALSIAADYGIALAREDVEARLRPDPLGLSRFEPAPVTLDRWPGQGWLPARSVPHAGPPAFDWAWFGDAPLGEPLYEESVRHAAALPFNRMFRTRTALADMAADLPNQAVMPPSGFVFHMSRCGSTLAGRMLMAGAGHVVASEPEPLDAVLTWATLSGGPIDGQAAALRTVVAALGRQRVPSQRRFFLKLDAWHAMLLPLFRAAFPDVPWVFLYRDPVEVIMSHLAEPGVHYVPGVLPPTLAGLDTSGWGGEADYCARILARVCDAAVEHWPLGGGMSVRFDDIHDAMMTAVPAHFGWQPDAAERATMTAVAGVDAKRPSARFTPDGAAKQKNAPPEVLAAAAAYLAGPIASLDKLRADGIRNGQFS